jgi:hypothetical protein|uniref:Uncharacterized protein n=1 Tax=Siphoviridae sp. ctGyV19 TaxID=2826225 RepID=A0A8S5MVK9_9CAUD|nr:MAG TPA: hypothetical protein [Siphoviridae sp. ctGyV19]
MKKRPDIGTKMYSVHEHLYYIPDYPAPVLEYVVLEAKVTGFYTLGYTEVCLVGKDPDGHNTPYRYPLNKIGKSLYYSKREAAVQAEQATKRYENTWGWVGDPHIPMRRTWKYLLLENVGERQMNIFDFPEVLP